MITLAVKASNDNQLGFFKMGNLLIQQVRLLDLAVSLQIKQEGYKVNETYKVPSGTYEVKYDYTRVGTL